ncbi:MAG: hypothetical protein IPH86_15935 [bacterium]|nr:hypothetical protein [bacterium]
MCASPATHLGPRGARARRAFREDLFCLNLSAHVPRCANARTTCRAWSATILAGFTAAHRPRPLARRRRGIARTGAFRGMAGQCAAAGQCAGARRSEVSGGAGRAVLHWREAVRTGEATTATRRQTRRRTPQPESTPTAT